MLGKIPMLVGPETNYIYVAIQVEDSQPKHNQNVLKHNQIMAKCNLNIT